MEDRGNYPPGTMLVALLLVIHFCLTAAIIFGLDWLALRSWRRAQDAHWTERARLLWPARVNGNLWFYALPFFQAAAQSILFPDIPGLYLLTALAGFAGGLMGSWPLSRTLFPRWRFPSWLLEIVVSLAIRFLYLGTLVAAGWRMPDHLGWTAVTLTAGLVAFKLWTIYGGLTRLFAVCGYFRPVPPRVVAVVRETAERMQMPAPSILIMRGQSADALAVLTTRTVAFSEGAVIALTDEELSAVCAHELAHLSEPPHVVRARILASFTTLPLIFIRPAFEGSGFFGALFLVVLVYVSRKATRDFAHRLEKRADAMAKEHEGASEGAYARALERLYEVNHTPAVLGGSRTHPDLYDRLVASGVAPEYPRPLAPEASTGTYWLLGILAAISVFTLIERVSDEVDAWKSSHRHKIVTGQMMLDGR